MSSIDWKLVSLGKLALINAKSISGKYPYKEIEYIDTSSVTGNEFSPLQKLELSEAPSRAKRIVQHGDTIISTVRPIQRHFGFIRNPKPNTIASTGFAVITPRSVNPEFLYYYLSQDSITNYLNGIAETSTTTFPAFRPEVLSELEILIPEDENIQRRIADILSALDDKIELNRQTNATLEAIAQAIFKEWFVDFNFPGATGEMVESELGMIPKGWRAGKLGEICKVTMGQSPPGESYNEDGIGTPFFQGRADFDFRFPRRRVYTTDPRRFANKFDTLVSVRAPVGDMNIATENCCIGRGLAAVIERNGNYSFNYYFLKELTEKFKGFEDNGTVFGSINKNEFESMACIIPSIEIITYYEEKCKVIDDEIFYREQESNTLTQIRDSLLPKLMSGEINSSN